MSKNFNYVNPTPNEFPIMAWGPTTHNQMPTLRDFQNFAECGFNVALFRGSDRPENGEWLTVFREGFRLAAQTGTRIIINSAILDYENAKMPNWAINLINEFKNNPMIAGFMVKDEPSYCRLLGKTLGDCPAGSCEDTENIDEIYPIKNAIDRAYAQNISNMAFFNLAADKKSTVIDGCSSYPVFLTKVNETILPPVWSYDLYPVRKNSSGVTYVELDRFYEYLGYFKSISDVSQRPFWAYCMCRANNNYPEATSGMLRFEAFSALAYGAQGIVYFEYRADAPYITPTTKEGEKTTIWHNVQTVNKEIKKWQTVFLECTVTLVKHAHKSSDGNLLAETIDCVDQIQSDGRGFIVSKIQKGSKKYIIIVSSDPLKTQKLYVKYNNTYQVVPSMPEEVDYDQQNPGSRYTLPEGGYLIIEYFK